jgi:type I restriction enzyme, S subunit
MTDLVRWSRHVLKGHIHVKHGFPFKSEHFAEKGEFIVLTPGNFWEAGGFKHQPGKETFYLSAFPAEYLHKKGDLVVAMTEQAEGLLGSMAFVPKNNCYLHNQRIGKVTATSNEVSLEFLYHAFKMPAIRSQLSNTASGSKVRHTSPERIYDVSLPFPPIDDQRRIAAFLSALDAKIDLNNLISAELEALAKTIYDYWFVQFQFPDTNRRCYKSGGGAMVWNDTLKREIPVGWGVASIGDTCGTVLGGTPDTKSPQYWENADIPWLSSSETSRFPVVSSEQFITSAGIRDSAAKLLPAGTVVVSIVRYIRPSILAIPAATNQSVVGVLHTDLIPSSYLYPAICREIPRWMGMRTGAQQPHINKTTVDATLILKPAETVINAYRKLVDPIFDRINVAAIENVELTQLRDWLLPLLMNGQVQIAALAKLPSSQHSLVSGVSEAFSLDLA